MGLMKPRISNERVVNNLTRRLAAELGRVDNGDGKVTRAEAKALSEEFQDDFKALLGKKKSLKLNEGLAAYRAALTAAVNKADTLKQEQFGAAFHEVPGKD